MRDFRATNLLPHEWIFGAFLMIHWVRLTVMAGAWDHDALLHLVLLLINAACIAWCLVRESMFTWHVRLWFYPVAMNVVFASMTTSVMKVNSHKYDAVLAACDKALFGTILSVRAEAIATPVLTEILSFFYLWFFPYLLLSWIYYAWRGLHLQRKLTIGMFTIYGLGFLGYSLVPAGGPHLAFPEDFKASLTGWAITRFNASIVARGSNGVDVFPSLHCALSTYLLFMDRRHARWRYLLYIVPCAGIWLATIYLRYHYVLDLVAGFLLAAFALWLTNRWERHTLEKPPVITTRL